MPTAPESGGPEPRSPQRRTVDGGRGADGRVSDPPGGPAKGLPVTVGPPLPGGGTRGPPTAEAGAMAGGTPLRTAHSYPPVPHPVFVGGAIFAINFFWRHVWNRWRHRVGEPSVCQRNPPSACRLPGKVAPPLGGWMGCAGAQPPISKGVGRASRGRSPGGAGKSKIRVWAAFLAISGLPGVKFVRGRTPPKKPEQGETRGLDPPFSARRGGVRKSGGPAPPIHSKWRHLRRGAGAATNP